MDLSWSSLPFIHLCAELTLCPFGFFTLFLYTSSYAIIRGMSQSLSFYTLAAINAGSALGRVLPGFVADRFEKFNILACLGVTASIVAFCWTSAASTPGIFVWATVYGFASEVCHSLYSTHDKEFGTPRLT